MKQVEVRLNGTPVGELGIIFPDVSLTALMTPAPAKSRISNKSRLEHGTRTVVTPGTSKTDAREVQLTFGLKASSLGQFLMRYRAFTRVLKDGDIDLTVKIAEGGTYLTETYRLVYISCTQYSEFNGRLAKFVLKASEPNPENRTAEYSEDIK